MLRWHRELVSYQPGCRKKTRHLMCMCVTCYIDDLYLVLCVYTWNRYFQNLVASFEAKMELYRRQIEELECHLSAIASETAMSPQSMCL